MINRHQLNVLLAERTRELRESLDTPEKKSEEQRLVAGAVSLDLFGSLTGKGSDLDTPEYLRLKEQLGFRDEELSNEFASFENRLHPDDRLVVTKQVERYLQGKINTILASIQAGVILVRKQDRVIVDANPAEAGNLAHKIKGAAANVTALLLQQTAQAMENAGMAGDLESLHRLVPELEHRFMQVQMQMENCVLNDRSF